MTPVTETEHKILEAARREFETKGYMGTRMQVIADAAGISKASLHYHFRSKDKLFDRIFSEALAEYIPIVLTWLDDSLGFEEKVHRFADQLVEFIRDGRMLFLIREINRNPDILNAHVKNKKKASVVAYFEEQMQKGKIRKTDPRLLYIFLNSLCCFPVVNKQMFQKGLRMSSQEYEELMQRYAKAAAEFFINAVKK